MQPPPVCPVKPFLAMKQIPNNLFFAWVESEIAEGRSVRFRLKGHSMFPLLRNERDEVVLHPCTEAELQPMDVVLFRHQGRHVLHRILRREGDRLLIQGDGSFVARETCTVGDVIGKVRSVVRPSGKELSVDHWRWRFPSFVWQHLGVLRNPLLRVLRRLFS